MLKVSPFPGWGRRHGYSRWHFRQKCHVKKTAGRGGGRKEVGGWAHPIFGGCGAVLEGTLVDRAAGQAAPGPPLAREIRIQNLPGCLQTLRGPGAGRGQAGRSRPALGER